MDFDNSIDIQPHFQKCLKNPDRLKGVDRSVVDAKLANKA